MTLVLPILNVERPAIIVSGYLKDFLNLHLVSGEIAIMSRIMDCIYIF